MAQDLTIVDGQDGFTDRQVAALVQLGVQEASPADLDLFFHQAVRTGLDPFARQIYMIGRRQKDHRTGEWVTKQTIQTGIDGFRLIARRAADARRETFSMDDVQWADPNGHWHDLWIWDTPPAAAKVVVHVGEGRFSAVAATREYMPTTRDGLPTGQWRTMPAVMIAKCAEALALRKAFPMDLSGVYTGEEMAQADVRAEVIAPHVEQPQPQAQQPAQQPPEPEPVEAVEEPIPEPQAAPQQEAPRASDEQWGEIYRWAQAFGIDKVAIGRVAWSVARWSDAVETITPEVADQILGYLRSRGQREGIQA